MKIFVIGMSNSGKTTLAKKIAELYGLECLSASEWVRTASPEFADGPKSDDQVAAMTEFTIATLKKNPKITVDFLNDKYDLTKSYVIEGVRNPGDFIRLFNPVTDYVVFITNNNNALKATLFEEGIGVIRKYLDYLSSNGLLGELGDYRVCDYNWDYFSEEDRMKNEDPCSHGSLEGKVLGFRNTHPRIAAALAKRPTGPSMVHAEIPPIKCLVKREFFYNMAEEKKGALIPCSIFAISSYPGHAVTFKILTADGHLFSYIPIDALVIKPNDNLPQLPMADLAYHNCPSKEICVNRFEALNRELRVFFKNRNLWMKGKYLLTVDWYMENELFHLIELENGQLSLSPSHKVRFADNDDPLPDYRALHPEWKV
ncbi:MAG: hypothetical protein G01um101419_588 [Parcubacteria group bacterium Gr01-1014_19]|nr:MAG: hypothetical protein G01um101419_588 [Parcubacteria group bacterium Gr01-1014_19]